MEFKYLNKVDYSLSYIQQNVEMFVYAMISFFAPFFIGHPQFLVGVIVNSALVMAALNLKSYKLLPIILFPSLGVLARGVIFGPLSIYLLYMIPFIWIGNSILVYAFKRFKKMPALFIGSLTKTGLLFLAALILVNLKLLPALFLTTMGLFQLYTALAGGILALGIHTVKKHV